MSDLPEVTEVQRIALKPGDQVVVRVGGQLSVEQAELIKARILATWPGVNLLVLPESMTVEVISPEDP